MRETDRDRDRTSAPRAQATDSPPPAGEGRPEVLLRQTVEELAEMVGWREGAFSFHPGGVAAIPPVSFDTQRVVTELFRVADERASRRSSP